MEISLFSFFMALLWCNIYIAIIALIRRQSWFILHFSIIPLVFLICTSIFRLIVFIELPETRIVESEIILPVIHKFMMAPVLKTGSSTINISITQVMVAIWMIGSIYNLLKYLIQIIRLNRFLKQLPETNNPIVLNCLSDIVGKSSYDKVRIKQSVNISTPMVIGYFNPTICLPDTVFSQDEIHHILLHEWTHFKHKHTWIKLYIHLISAAFWWNPFIHLLKKEIGHVLEIQCDLYITSGMNDDNRIHYLESIMKVIKNIRKHKYESFLNIHSSSLVSANSASRIEQRFNLVMEYKEKIKWRKAFIITLCSLVTITFLISYMFIIQPRHSPNDGSIVIGPKNSFLVDNKDGTYAVYVDGIYLFDVSDISDEPLSQLSIK